MRYRYIFNGGVKASDKISDYRLLDKQKIQGENDVIRVKIPEDAKLEKWACDEYSTWDSSNERDFLVSELNPKICVKINGRWNILEEATSDWLNGKKMRDAIKDNLGDKYCQNATLNVGYVTWEQYAWMQKNEKVSWRFKSLPFDLEKAKIPPLTPSELKTLDFVREKFNEYYEELVEESRFYEEDEKQEAKDFLKELVDNISNDDLAYEWHRYSITSLDPYRRFEIKEMVDKMEKSKYAYVYKDHYKYAIRQMIENMSMKFTLEKYLNDRNKDIER